MRMLYRTWPRLFSNRVRNRQIPSHTIAPRRCPYGIPPFCRSAQSVCGPGPLFWSSSLALELSGILVSGEFGVSCITSSSTPAGELRTPAGVLIVDFRSKLGVVCLPCSRGICYIASRGIASGPLVLSPHRSFKNRWGFFLLKCFGFPPPCSQ